MQGRTFWIAAWAAVALAIAGCSSRQLLNAVPARGDTQVATNVVYDAAHKLRLDVYAPADANDAPLVVFFFGDRWERGDKSDYQFVGRALADQGFVALVVNTRLYPPATYKQFLADSAHAVMWAHQHAAEYGASPQKLFLMGFSAGAYNVAMLALDPGYLKAAGGSRDEVAGVIGISGPYNFMPITASDLRAIFWPPSDFAKTQPVYWASHGGNPPMLLLASRADKLVNASSTQTLFGDIKQAGGPVEEIFYNDLSNQDTIQVLAPVWQKRADEMQNIVSFVHRTLMNPPYRGVPEGSTGGGGIATQPASAISVLPLQAPIAIPVPSQSVAPPAAAASVAAPAAAGRSQPM
ncbi:MAG TPA: alpha/beta hydrolase [Nevskiaceae bacterium]|nr:alpha/beta hydrolase [Nevskiaceae bacterium]